MELIQHEADNIKLNILYGGEDNVIANYNNGTGDRCVAGFWQGDYDLLIHSDSGISKLLSKFQKAPVKFNITLAMYNSYEGNRAVMKLPDFAKEFITDENSINAVITNNATTDKGYIPFNGWIAAHRVAHAFLPPISENKGLLEQFSNKYKNYSNEVILNLHSLHKSVSRPVLGETNMPFSLNNPTLAFMKQFMTMRSARNSLIVNDLDPFAELFAQYVVTGKITLRRFTKDFHMRSFKYAYDTREGYWSTDGEKFITALFDKLSENDDVEKVNAIIEDYENKLNNLVHDLCLEAVGKTFKF